MAEIETVAGSEQFPCLTIDRDADAAYLEFAAGMIAETVEIQGGAINIDLDEYGQILGIEILSLAPKWAAGELGMEVPS